MASKQIIIICFVFTCLQIKFQMRMSMKQNRIVIVLHKIFKHYGFRTAPNIIFIYSISIPTSILWSNVLKHKASFVSVIFKRFIQPLQCSLCKQATFSIADNSDHNKNIISICETVIQWTSSVICYYINKIQTAPTFVIASNRMHWSIW